MKKEFLFNGVTLAQAIILISIGILVGVLSLPINIYLLKNLPSYDNAIMFYAFIGLIGLIGGTYFQKHNFRIKIKLEKLKKVQK